MFKIQEGHKVGKEHAERYKKGEDTEPDQHERPFVLSLRRCRHSQNEVHSAKELR